MARLDTGAAHFRRIYLVVSIYSAGSSTSSNSVHYYIARTCCCEVHRTPEINVIPAQRCVRCNFPTNVENSLYTSPIATKFCTGPYSMWCFGACAQCCLCKCKVEAGGTEKKCEISVHGPQPAIMLFYPSCTSPALGNTCNT